MTRSSLRDYAALSKPSILLLSVLMAALGFWLAPDSIGLARTVWVLVGTGLVVGSANALNMVLEVDVDAFMTRTKNRPLPTGRMTVTAAAVFGVAIGLLGTVILYLAGNPLTAIIGYAAIVSYVGIYTPAKRKTPLALAIGAIPGAAPPLMGWAAATGTIDLPGVILFLVLLVWQLPHFIAIAIYRQGEYARAGFKTVPIVRGVEAAKWQALAYATSLVPLSMALAPLGATTWVYGGLALAISTWFLWQCLKGFRSQPANRWARRVFLASLAYLPALALALLVDRLVG
jgi:protoheme IX farnesyltransferase